MQRKARSRSDAPRLIVASGTPFTIIGTIGITTGSIVVGNGSTVAISTGSITIGTGVQISGRVVGGADGTSALPWASR